MKRFVVSLVSLNLWLFLNPFLSQYVNSEAQSESQPCTLPVRVAEEPPALMCARAALSSCFLFVKAPSPPDNINFQQRFDGQGLVSLVMLMNSLLWASWSNCHI